MQAAAWDIEHHITSELLTVTFGLYPLVQRGLETGQPSPLALGPALISPLEAVYYHLGRLVVGEIHSKRCKSPDCRCYLRVVSDNSLREYCPFPVDPLSGYHGRSRCATRHRLQSHRGNVKYTPRFPE